MPISSKRVLKNHVDLDIKRTKRSKESPTHDIDKDTYSLIILMFFSPYVLILLCIEYWLNIEILCDIFSMEKALKKFLLIEAMCGMASSSLSSMYMTSEISPFL